MLNKKVWLGLTIAVFAIALPSPPTGAQEQPPPTEEPPAIPSGGRPEYTPKKLPNDTFKPSEKISEDFPVPFPVDI